jgi:hypothetical protein
MGRKPHGSWTGNYNQTCKKEIVKQKATERLDKKAQCQLDSNSLGSFSQKSA